MEQISQDSPMTITLNLNLNKNYKSGKKDVDL